MKLDNLIKIADEFNKLVELKADLIIFTREDSEVFIKGLWYSKTPSSLHNKEIN